MIANYFMANLPADEKQAEKAINILRETVSAFVANMEFTDGKPNELDHSLMEQKTLHLDNVSLNLFFQKSLMLS